MCPEALKVYKTGVILTLILTLANTNPNPNPNSEAMDVVCKETYFQKLGQFGPRAKNNRANQTDLN
jgi:hypothetical protein